MRPDYADAHYHLGRTYFRQGKFDQAIEQFKLVVELQQYFTEAYYEWGRVLLAQGKAREAVSRFTEALRTNPSHTKTQYELGLVMANMGRFALALPQFEGVLQQNPDHAEAHYHLARCLVKLERIDEGIAHYREALWLRPDWQAALNDLAWLYSTCADDSKRNADGATALADRSMAELNRMMPLVLDTLAAAKANAGDTEKAAALQQEAIDWAQRNNDEPLVKELERRLPIYKSGQPYHQPSAEP